MISLEAFSRLVGVIYDAASASDWEEVLGSLAQATGASVGGLVVDGNGHVPDIARTVGANPDALDSYKRYYHAIDPVIPALLRKATGAVIT
jgi:hypothetical protein